MKISVVIITRNEEKILAGSLESVKWADEIIVVDSGSTDSTREIAKAFGAKVIIRKWDGFAGQKNFAICSAKNIWVLSLDADEVLTGGLKEEIQSVINSADAEGYYIPRRTYFYGKQLRHGNIYPDNQLRLFKKDSGKYEETEIHERFLLKGNPGYLKNPMCHYSKESIQAHVEAMNKYTSLEVKRAVKIGYRPTGYSVLIKPVLYFMKHYVLKGGFLDGFAGLVYYVINAVYIFTRELKIMEVTGFSNYNLLSTLHKRAR